jgi:hypothetical protein
VVQLQGNKRNAFSNSHFSPIPSYFITYGDGEGRNKTKRKFGANNLFKNIILSKILTKICILAATNLRMLELLEASVPVETVVLLLLPLDEPPLLPADVEDEANDCAMEPDRDGGR